MRAAPRAKVNPPTTTINASISAAAAGLSFDDLTPEEQRAASLGAAPDELRCISWLNKAHKDALVSKGLLSPGLEANLKAHEDVAKAAAL